MAESLGWPSFTISGLIVDQRPSASTSPPGGILFARCGANGYAIFLLVDGDDLGGGKQFDAVLLAAREQGHDADRRGGPLHRGSRTYLEMSRPEQSASPPGR